MGHTSLTHTCRLWLARVRDRGPRCDRCSAIRALLERGGARGAGEEVVARPEDDRPRRVGLHADRAQEAVLERLLLALDPPEVNGGRVRRGLERLEVGRGRLAHAFGRRPARLSARVHVKNGDAREAVELVLEGLVAAGLRFVDTRRISRRASSSSRLSSCRRVRTSWSTDQLIAN